MYTTIYCNCGNNQTSLRPKHRPKPNTGYMLFTVVVITPHAYPLGYYVNCVKMNTDTLKFLLSVFSTHYIMIHFGQHHCKYELI
jgi:hypothetical protein